MTLRYVQVMSVQVVLKKQSIILLTPYSCTISSCTISASASYPRLISSPPCYRCSFSFAFQHLWPADRYKQSVNNKHSPSQMSPFGGSPSIILPLHYDDSRHQQYPGIAVIMLNRPSSQHSLLFNLSLSPISLAYLLSISISINTVACTCSILKATPSQRQSPQSRRRSADNKNPISPSILMLIKSFFC